MEALLVALGCALLLWSLALVEGSQGRGAAAAAVVGFSAALTAWVLAHRQRGIDVARRIDRGLALGEGFLTAYQVEGQHGPGPLRALLLRRSTQDLRWPDVRRVILPPSLVCAAAPFLGAACLAAALQYARERAPEGPSNAWAAGALVEDLQSARRAALGSRVLDEATVAEIEELASQAKAQADAAGAAGSETSSGAGPEPARQAGLEQLRERVEQVAEEAQGDPRVDEALERVASDLEALLGPQETRSGTAVENAAGAELAQVQAGDPGAAEPQASPAVEDPGAAGAQPAASSGGSGGASDGSSGEGGQSSAGGAAAPAGQSSPQDDVELASSGDSQEAPPQAIDDPGLQLLPTLPVRRRSLALRWLENRSPSSQGQAPR